MNAVMHNFMNDVPQAAGIWLALLLFALLAVAGMFAGTARQRAADRTARIREAVRRRVRLASEVAALNRYAEEVAVAADRAAATAVRQRQQWLAAQEEAETAWRSYDAADAAARRMAGAGALPAPHTPHTPAEYADRERYLHRAAVSACWRGELSILELTDALAHRGGWDPRRHPVEQEVFLRRFVRDRLGALHRVAADRERVAWQAAEAATVAARSLRDEATAAATRARQALAWWEPAGTLARPVREAFAPARPAIGWHAARAG
ncbi:MAG TPA: hypothetical protein VFR67_15350 [Pilimelia sp.]|nr:hypothetical protein [Pilimelia sp.]